MNDKFSLTSETVSHFGTTLYRIRAEKDFGNVKKGTLGGFVEKEANLSAQGNAWVSGDAQVYGNAQVYWNAWVSGNAQVYWNARVSGNAQVYWNARVYGNAQVYWNAWVSGNAQVYCNAWVSDYACVYGNARVSDYAQVYGNAWVSDCARVFGKIKLQFWWCFGCKRKDWKVTEVENGEEILLIKDYAPAEKKEEPKKKYVTDENGVKYELVPVTE